MYMTLGLKRKLVALMYHGGIILISLIGSLLGMAASSQGTIMLFSGILFLHLLTFRLNPLGCYLEQKLITEASCPECGSFIDLINFWSCHCSYSAHKPRHAFSSCGNCGKVFALIDCPYCEASIRI